MALSNRERVGKALELLRAGLLPFIEREMKAVHGATWETVARGNAPESKGSEKARKAGTVSWDTQALLAVVWDHWNAVFTKKLGRTDRSIVQELRDVRNSWAHEEPFTVEDADRAIDDVARLLTSVGAPEAEEARKLRQELRRLSFEEQARKEVRKATAAPIEGQPLGGLLPWREVVTPHPDVASGNFQQAEFAADLAQVYRGEGSDEYRKPRQFFQRTHLTEGLRLLLTGALKRVSGTGGDPVVELQTSFGGGKTHSMLALFHVVSGVGVEDLPGIEPILADVGLSRPPKTARAVLVGTALSPAQIRKKGDGVEVRTLWGEMAYQLLGKSGYQMVAASDKAGVSPGSDILREVFQKAAPCLVLIDEWVAYARQLSGVSDLPGGTFEANLTFAQALTEAVRAVPKALLVATIPDSDIEAAGEAGKEALVRLKHTFGRMQASWRPATAEESFEIVRRRLFEPVDPTKAAARDAVIRAFSEYYRANHQDFPRGCGEGDYERRLTSAYPIHPELFDRLYTDWSSLERFQRTRGVLRLMAQVIRELWRKGDKGLLILPASVPVDEGTVQSELTRYLEDPWVPVLERDVDGPGSVTAVLDQENPNFGRYSACRRVARAIFLGSAPTLHTAQRGLDRRNIKLGCAQPGESAATFGDALARLTDRAMHLYVDGERYWFSTQQTVARLAADRAGHLSIDKVHQEIRERLRAATKDERSRGDFDRIHVCPEGGADVSDEPEARLVVLDPEHPHVTNDWTSSAAQQAATILGSRGSTPRLNRNSVVFLAADKSKLTDLESAVRLYLAWKSIHEEEKQLNLDEFQRKQAEAKWAEQFKTVDARIPEAFQWLLVPGQERDKDGKLDPQGKVLWSQVRLQGQDPIAVRASKKLRTEELLITQLGPTRLRMEMDRIPLWRDDGRSVPVRQLVEDFGKYLYLPRLRNTAVLLEAIEGGLNLISWDREGFAYADSLDLKGGRFQGLRSGQVIRVHAETGLVVHPAVARKQMDADAAAAAVAAGKVAETTSPFPGTGGSGGTGPGSTTPPEPEKPKKKEPRRYYGSVKVDPVRLGRDAGTIAQEVIQHLLTLPGAKVEITLDIHAELPSGAPDNVVRTVTENARTLKFKAGGFEDE